MRPSLYPHHAYVRTTGRDRYAYPACCFMYEFQRYEAEQQHYVDANSIMITGSWQPYVKNYAPNQSHDYGNRAAALWLDRQAQ